MQLLYKAIIIILIPLFFISCTERDKQKLENEYNKEKEKVLEDLNVYGKKKASEVKLEIKCQTDLLQRKYFNWRDTNILNKEEIQFRASCKMNCEILKKKSECNSYHYDEWRVVSREMADKNVDINLAYAKRNMNVIGDIVSKLPYPPSNFIGKTWNYLSSRIFDKVTPAMKRLKYHQELASSKFQKAKKDEVAWDRSLKGKE